MDTKIISLRKIKAIILMIVFCMALAAPLAANAGTRLNIPSTGRATTTTVGDANTTGGALITSNNVRNPQGNINAHSRSRPNTTPHTWTRRAHLTNFGQHAERNWGTVNAPRGHRWHAEGWQGTGAVATGIVQIRIFAR